MAADVSDIHQLNLRNIYWISTASDGKTVWKTGNSGGEKPSEPGNIGRTTLTWNRKEYPIIEYKKTSETEFVIKTDLGILTMTQWRGKLWEGNFVYPTGKTGRFRNDADQWPSDPAIKVAPR
jgi:hypothetical protein